MRGALSIKIGIGFPTSGRGWSNKTGRGKELDKDLLVPGNKEYGENFCIFVEKRINGFITDCAAGRGMLPIGVYLDKTAKEKPYKCNCSCVVTGKPKYLGKYATPEEAHEVWLDFKLQQAYILASSCTDERLAKALINRYENYEKY